LIEHLGEMHADGPFRRIGDPGCVEQRLLEGRH
jgi:hypothetical protein